MDERLAAHIVIAAESDEEFLDLAYRFALRRPADDAARDGWLPRLQSGAMSRATLVRELVGSDDFERLRVLDDAVALARGARARGERPRWLRGPPGHDERVVEIPWVLARYAGEPRVLDVGYAYAEPVYLAALLALGAHELVGVDLVENEIPGLRPVVADLRELPFEQDSFDLVFCVSTLEHIGLDNRVYGLAAERDERGRSRALRELRRVLARGGRLLVTVPCGEPQDLGWQVQDDVDGWNRLFTRAGFFIAEEEVYELGDAGWRAAPEFDPAGVRYRERGPGASAVLCAELRPGRLRAVLTPAGMRATARRRAARPWRRLRRLLGRPAALPE